jgi:hypothetical protein
MFLVEISESPPETCRRADKNFFLFTKRRPYTNGHKE